jgi:anti-sigma-K factor RskA
MSEGPELPDAEAFAAEHALGVLDADERARAEHRMAREPAFAADVEAWTARLAPMLDEIRPVEPRATVWRRIERALPANDNAGAGVAFWRRAALGGFALAAASMVAALVIVAQRPEPVVAPQAPPPGQLLNARIDTPKGDHLFVAAWDPARKAVLISSLVPPGAGAGHVHQLWLIPADGKPRSLGFVTPGTSVAIPVSALLAGLTDERAALAVSVEAPGGSKKDGPTGPVVAVGKLSRI